jgi:endoglycosylceramidase
MLLILLLLLLTLVSGIIQDVNTIKVNPSTNTFIDKQGRTRIFHGVNAVYKLPPYYPETTGFNASSSLSPQDAINLKSWGFNIVRLGVMWVGLEPKRGQYDFKYLDQIESIVKILNDQDIYVLLDFHQDVIHRKFCGEGVPDYIMESCMEHYPDAKQFPLPVKSDQYPFPYPQDADGNPTIEACLSKKFFSYYFSDQVGKTFQCLYKNVDNSWRSFGDYWELVAKRFSTFDNVIGYELINEPSPGDIVSEPELLLPHVTEKHLLQPLYQYLNTRIRAVDEEKIVMYEGLTYDYFQSGFTQAPGGPSYNDRQAYSYHIYCPLKNESAVHTVINEFVCGKVDDEFFTMRKKDVERLGGGMIMTEFGAEMDVTPQLLQIDQLLSLVDKYQQSWIYWQFKFYQDITTCCSGESLYDENGNIYMDKVKSLSRTYPQAVAGNSVEYKFNSFNAEFDMSYTASSSNSNTDTIIYFNYVSYYFQGIAVSVVAPDEYKNQISFQVTDGKYVVITSNFSTSDEVPITVKLSVCDDSNPTPCAYRNH